MKIKDLIIKHLGYVCDLSELARVSGFGRYLVKILDDSKKSSLCKFQEIARHLNIELGIIFSDHERAIFVIYNVRCVLEDLNKEICCSAFKELLGELENGLREYIESSSTESIIKINNIVKNLTKVEFN